MSTANDARFWDRTSRKYAQGAIADPAGFERTLEKTRSVLRSDDSVLELGCGTGTTAFRLAGAVRDYRATDISGEMIAIAEERCPAGRFASLTFQAASVEALCAHEGQFNAVLGFNYLHLVRDLPGVLRRIHLLLAREGLFISKTPCVGDMNPLIGHALLPAMRAIGMAPFAGVFRAAGLVQLIGDAGFDILAAESHATDGDDHRPYIIARKP